MAPTGSGKTIIAAAVIQRERRALQKQFWCWRIVARSSRRPATSCSAYGIASRHHPGRAFAASARARAGGAAIQTLHRRAIRSDAMDLPPADLSSSTNATTAPAKTYQKIIAAYPNATLLGLTATPCRGDGRGLGGIFETMIECPQVAELIQQGYLVGTRVYAPVDPDLKGVARCRPATITRPARRAHGPPRS